MSKLNAFRDALAPRHLARERIEVPFAEIEADLEGVLARLAAQGLTPGMVEHVCLVHCGIEHAVVFYHPEVLDLRARVAQLEAEVARFKANNRYQRGFADGELAARKDLALRVAEVLKR